MKLVLKSKTKLNENKTKHCFRIKIIENKHGLKESNQADGLIKTIKPSIFLKLTNPKKVYDNIVIGFNNLRVGDNLNNFLALDTNGRKENLKYIKNDEAVSFLVRASQFLKPSKGYESLDADKQLRANINLHVNGDGRIEQHDGRHRALAKWLRDGDDKPLTVIIKMLDGSTKLPKTIYSQDENDNTPYSSSAVFSDAIDQDISTEVFRSISGFLSALQSKRELEKNPPIKQFLNKFNDTYDITFDNKPAIVHTAIELSNSPTGEKIPGLNKVGLFDPSVREIRVQSMSDIENMLKIQNLKFEGTGDIKITKK